MTNSIISLCQFVASRAIKSISNGLYFIFKRKAITANFVTYAHTRRHIPHSPRYNILIHPHFLYFIRFSVRTPCVCVCLFISSILHLFNLFIESITCCDSLNFPHARVYVHALVPTNRLFVYRWMRNKHTWTNSLFSCESKIGTGVIELLVEWMQKLQRSKQSYPLLCHGKIITMLSLHTFAE